RGDADVHVWDVPTGRERSRFRHQPVELFVPNGGPGPFLHPRPLWFLPGGLLAVGDGQGGMDLRDPSSGKVRSSLAPGWAGAEVAFAPDGKSLAFRTTDPDTLAVALRWVDLAGGGRRDLPSDRGEAAPGPTRLAFSADGKLLAALECGAVRVHELASGETV